MEEGRVSKTRIIVDLKAALDGYSGIPQEARLLFSALRSLPEDHFETTGLIQSDGVVLDTPDPDLSTLAYDERVYQTAKFIASFDFSIPENKWRRYQYVFQLRRHLNNLERRARNNTLSPLGGFEETCSVDFLWRRLFEKTLNHHDMDRVCRGPFRTMSAPRAHMQQTGMRQKHATDENRYLTLDTRGYDVFIAQNPFPGRVADGTKLVVRYHDPAPLVMTHTINNKTDHLNGHYFALKSNIANGGYFVCVSNAVRDQLISLFPEVEPRVHVIHNVVSDSYFQEEASASSVRDILQLRRSPAMLASMAGGELEQEDAGAPRYVLCVSTLEPRKNHKALIRAWEHVKRKSATRLKLVLVGGEGWDSEDILHIAEPWMRREELIHLSNLPASELRQLYRRAELVVCPSVFEGFGYSGVEAMLSGGALLASDLPVHREVYGDAAFYFDPYDIDSLVRSLEQLIGGRSSARNARAQLRSASAKVAEKFSVNHSVECWKSLLQQINAG